jgi:GxxExxY protein
VSDGTTEYKKGILYKNESYLIRGAVFEVYSEIGCKFVNAVYQECLESEFHKQRIPFVSQPVLQLFYQQEKLRQIYKPDSICYDKIIVKLKAVKEICNEHRARWHNYLKATGLLLECIVNFRQYSKANIERIVK